MANPQPKVALEYNVADERYYVAMIRGNRVGVDFGRGGETGKVARVGMWLSEAEANLLGLSADLTIKRWTI